MFGLIFLAAIVVLVVGVIAAVRRRRKISRDAMAGSRMFCKRCGYSLRGIPGPQCPECSAPFDPADPRTYSEVDPRLQPRIPTALRWGLYTGALGFVLGFAGPLILTPGANQGPLLGICFTGPFGFMAGCIAGGVRDIVIKSRQRRR